MYTPRRTRQSSEKASRSILQMIHNPYSNSARTSAVLWPRVIFFPILSLGCQAVNEPTLRKDSDKPLERFEPSPPEVLSAMLDAAQVTSADTVYDLGSGDGRLVIQAARQYGAHGVGIEIDDQRLLLARERALEAGVETRAIFRQADALGEDISAATVVALFLSLNGNPRLEERLRTHLRPGTRVVSLLPIFTGRKPERTVRVAAAGKEHTVHVWTVQGAETSPNLGPFVPTPMPIVRLMLEMAQVGPKDLVYDLGCGDGRIVIEAARIHGAHGVGIEYDARLCKEAMERAEREGVADLVEIRHEDVTLSNFSDATVVALYLLPKSNELLRPRIQALRPGTRIVAHDFSIGDWKPRETREVWLRDNTERRIVRLWHVGE